MPTTCAEHVLALSLQTNASASCSRCSATAPSTTPSPPPSPSQHEHDQQPQNRRHRLDYRHRGTRRISETPSLRSSIPRAWTKTSSPRPPPKRGPSAPARRPPSTSWCAACSGSWPTGSSRSASWVARSPRQLKADRYPAGPPTPAAPRTSGAPGPHHAAGGRRTPPSRSPARLLAAIVELDDALELVATRNGRFRGGHPRRLRGQCRPPPMRRPSASAVSGPNTRVTGPHVRISPQRAGNSLGLNSGMVQVPVPVTVDHSRRDQYGHAPTSTGGG